MAERIRADAVTAEATGEILVAGIYLSEQSNLMPELVRRFGENSRWRVTQRWMAIGPRHRDPAVAAVTTSTRATPAPKFVLLNQLLAGEELARFDYVVLSDDDIELPAAFLESYLTRVVRYDFAMAQPARTRDSFIDHIFVAQLDGLEARQTRFVEIGPLLSLRRDVVSLIVPFEEASAMGWGLDFTWPKQLEARGLKLGIVDATPVRHALRKPVANYAHGEAQRQMESYLRSAAHLSPLEAFQIVRSYS